MLELLPPRHPADTISVAASTASDTIFIILYYLFQFLHLKSRIPSEIFTVNIINVYLQDPGKTVHGMTVEMILESASVNAVEPKF